MDNVQTHVVPAKQSDVNVINSLAPQKFDSIATTFDANDNPSVVAYKQGAQTVRTLTITWTAGSVSGFNPTNIAIS